MLRSVESSLDLKKGSGKFISVPKRLEETSKYDFFISWPLIKDGTATWIAVDEVPEIESLKPIGNKFLIWKEFLEEKRLYPLPVFSRSKSRIIGIELTFKET